MRSGTTEGSTGPMSWSSVRIDREVIEQGIRYNRVLNVKYMMFTNGEKMYFCERTGDGPEYRFLPQIPDIKI